MPAQPLQCDAFVLVKRPPAESFQSVTLFSAEHGALFALQRIAKRAGGDNQPLDLFDEAALVLESSNQGRTWFIRENRLITRHAEIGRSYEALLNASALAGLIARNPVDEESRPAVAELLRTALAAFAAGARPEIVYFKSLFRFARDEGYPLKQQWFPTLAPADQADVATLLNRPLMEQALPVTAVARLRGRLENYLREHSEVLLD